MIIDIWNSLVVGVKQDDESDKRHVAVIHDYDVEWDESNKDYWTKYYDEDVYTYEVSIVPNIWNKRKECI